MPEPVMHAEAPPPRPQDIRTHGGPSDRPPGAVAPGWWLLEQRVLDMLAAHTAEMGPWDAAMAVFADHPRPARGRQRPDAGRSPLGILTDAWCNRRRHTEEPR